MSLTSTYVLNDGNKIPVVGFGTWQTPDGEIAKHSVLKALEVGYRHIDTAAAYQNEGSVGAAITESGIPRAELYITTKLANPIGTYEAAVQAIDDSLKALGTDYIDLYLIHWPTPIAFREDWATRNADCWRAMEEAVAAGKIKTIGVSNFLPHHLEKLFETATIKPAVNQIYLNPSDQQVELVAFNQKHGMLSEAYSPLGTGNILEIKALQELADAHNKSIAQIVLRWSLQKGFLPLPKSVTDSRIVENSLLFDFELSAEEMKQIDQLQGVAGSALNPDEASF